MIPARVQASGASESDGASAGPGYCPCEQAPRLVVAKQDDTPAPTFASALLTRQLDDFMDYLGALATTMRGILASEATDKGAQIAQALDDFRGAVLGASQQAGLEITEKRALIPPALEAEILRALLKLAPRDPLGKGGTLLAKALRQLRQDLAA